MRRLMLSAVVLSFGCGGEAAAVRAPEVTIAAPEVVSTASATKAADAAPSAAPVASAAPKKPTVEEELAQLDVAMVAALNAKGQGGAVLAGGPAPSGLAGLSLNAGGGGTLRPGSGGGLAGITPGGATGAPGQATVKGPIGGAMIGGAAVKGGNVSNAAAVIAGMAAGFRRCFTKGLQDDPNMKGSVTITAAIGPNGEVLSASPSGGKGLSGKVVACVAARVSSAQLAPPDGGAATTITIPITFAPVAP